MIAKSGIGDLLYNMGESLNDTFKITGSALQLAGVAATNAPLIPILMSLFGSSGTMMDLFNSAKIGNDAVRLFSELGSGAMSGGTVKISDAGVSGSMYVSSTGINDMLSGSTNSLSDLTSTVTTVENEGPSLEENVMTITDTVTAIFDLLSERLESIDTNVFTLAATNNVTSAAVTGWTTVTGFNI